MELHFKGANVKIKTKKAIPDLILYKMFTSFDHRANVEQW